MYNTVIHAYTGLYYQDYIAYVFINIRALFFISPLLFALKFKFEKIHVFTKIFGLKVLNLMHLNVQKF